MFGFRAEGRRVRHMDPIIQATPYLMPMRCDAMVFLHHDVEYDTLMRYIADKSRNEGVKDHLFGNCDRLLCARHFASAGSQPFHREQAVL